MRTHVLLAAAALAGCGTPSYVPLSPDAAADRPRDRGAPPEDRAPLPPPPPPPPPTVVVSAVRELPALRFQGVAQRWGARVVFLHEEGRAMVTEDLDARDGITDLRSPSGADDFTVLPRTAAGCPGLFTLSPYGAGAWVTTERGALVSFAKACTREGPGSDFRGVGVAAWSSPEVSARLAGEPSGAAEPELTMPVGLRATSAWLREGSGADAMIYGFDCHRSGFVVFQCRLARAPEAMAGERDAWRHWDGATWSTSAPRDFLTEVATPDITVSHSAFLGRYLMVYGSIWDTGELTFRTAPRLTGPWSAPTVITRPRLPRTGGFWNLRARHLTPYDRDDGRTIYVAYNSSSDGGMTVEHRLVEVTFALQP